MAEDQRILIGKDGEGLCCAQIRRNLRSFEKPA
jgi:hypothetical protein